MTTDLLELTRNYFIGNTVRQASTFFTTSEGTINRLLHRIIPLVLGSLLVHARQPAGATDLFAMVYRIHRRNLLGNFSGVLTNLNALASQGRPNLLHTALGSAYAPTLAELSQQTAANPAVADQLVSVAEAIALGLLGRHAEAHKLGRPGLANYLGSQRTAMLSALASLPHGLGHALAVQVGPYPGAPAPRQASKVLHHSQVNTTPAARPAARPVPAAPRRWPWLLALLLVGVLAIAAVQVYLLRGDAKPAPVPSAARAGSPTTAAAPPDRPNAASNDHLAYIAGRATLPLAGGTKLHVSNNSAEARLYHFLEDPAQTVALDKTQGWILLDQVYFAPGTTTLTPESRVQLANLAGILRAYPHATVKLGGYTDDQPSADKNLVVSADCANAARRQVLSYRIGPGRVAAEGYGQAPTRTAPPASRTQSRRVYVRVTKKY